MKIRATMYVKNHELEERRKALGMTVPEFAMAVKMSPARYRAIETLKRVPTEDEALTIAILLKTPDDVLFPEGYEKVVRVFDQKIEKIVDYTPPLLEEGDGMLLLEQANTKITVEKLMKGLSPKEKNIIELRHGMGTGPALTLEETAKVVGVTRERIRQIEAKALERMREKARDQHYKKTLNVDDIS